MIVKSNCFVLIDYDLIDKPEKLWLLMLRIINQGTVLEMLVLLYSRLVMTL